MSINGILSSGLSAILTNSAALRVTANNIANVNTPGYVRRVIHTEAMAPAGQLGGVALADIQRAADAFFDREAVSAQGAFSRYDTQSGIMDQLNGVLGSPGAGSSLSSRLDGLYAALGQATLDPALLANRQGVLYQFQALAQSVSELSESLGALRQSAEQRLGLAADNANDMIKQIFDLNFQIQRVASAGEMSNGLLDQRDMLVQDLSKLVGIRTLEQGDGRMFLTTLDGVSLIGDAYTRLNHQPSSGPTYNPLMIETIDARTGQAIGTERPFDAHATGGEIGGLIDMRDRTLDQLGAELGSFAQALSLAMNAQHNANTAIPPPGSMTGRQTGLLGTDALNFSGQATIGLASSSGTLQHNIAIDFTAGTITLDGGVPSSIGTTVDSFVTALNAALGGDGTAVFADGVLKLSANGGSGLVITGEPGSAATRGGVGFSHFFGLNDLFTASGQAIQTTGLTSGDDAGLAPGGVISLLLKGPNGERVNEVDVPVTGTSIGDMVGALNTAFAGKANFTLDADGKLSMTAAAGYQSYSLEVTNDTTVRGTTGASFTSLFGLGTSEASRRATGFSVARDLANAPQRLALAQSSLTSATPLGTLVGGAGDNRGLLALQGLLHTSIPFSAGGALPARNTTLGDYAATFYQDISARGQIVDANRQAQSTRLAQAQTNQSQAGGVNMDEELANMMTLQQAYNAGARLMRVADELLSELLNIV